ncbi:TonB-dependent receptor [Muriicola soli]|nr:TonB-dependent receptor plug domain-containing protein [Muriicola soli]
MKIPLLFCTVLLVFFPNKGTLHAQPSAPGGDENFEKVYLSDAYQEQQSFRDSLFLWQENVRLHTDKSIFLPGEVLFFKADILTGPEQLRVSASEVLKVEFLDKEGVLLMSQFLRIENGMSYGSIEIPRKIDQGHYYLRAYTRWMLNYGPDVLATKEVFITNKRSQSKFNLADVVLRPESGSLIDQLPSQVMVYHKYTSLQQTPVVDSKGRIVTRINDFGRGIGRFLLTPSKDEAYYIMIEEDVLIPLPEVKAKGYTIQTNNLNPDKALIRVEASEQLLKKAVTLNGKRKGQTIFKKEIEFENNSWEQIEIPKNELAEGILELTIEDLSGQVWASRPMQIEQNELQIKVERTTASAGNEIYKVQVLDFLGNPVETELSVSLVEERDAALSGRSAIRDLQEGINSRNQRFIDDMLLLTGQSDEHQNYINANQIPDEITYTFQQGLEFYGQAYDLNNSLLTNTEIQMLITAGEEAYAIETKTNPNGMFKISGMQIDGEAHIIFRTPGEETEEKLVKVVPYEYEIPPLKLSENALIKPKNRKGSDPEMPQRSMQDFSSESESEKLIELDQVTLVATRELQKVTPSRFDLRATRVIEQDLDRPKTLPQLFLNIPGVQVVGLGTLTPRIFIPRAAQLGPLLWVIDGFPLNQTTRLVDVMNLLSFVDVERIELLIGAEASVYGSRAAGGVILIYTRTGSDIDYLERKDAEVQFRGFQESLDFKEYVENKKSKRIAEHVPNTLYWNPQLKTNSNGEAVINLSQSSNNSPISVTIKANTENGLKGNTISFFK